jgi:hydroxymethylbilane synthase
VQCRAEDAELANYLAAIDDATTHAAATAERAFLRTLGAGCRLPIGAYATVDGASMRLDALLGDEEGKPHRADAKGPVSTADQLGAALAYSLRKAARV